jgi:hypothetical protein
MVGIPMAGETIPEALTADSDFEIIVESESKKN